MIDKLTGKISGQDVTFYKVGDNFSAVIPKDLSGEYVVELWAVDTAGNLGHTSFWLFTVDPTTLDIHLTPFTFYLECVESYSIDAVKMNYALELVSPRLERVML